MFITEAFAQDAGGSGGTAGLLVQFLPIILIFVIMYFLILRPQQARQRQHKEMIANIRRGDTIVTSGGLIGKVAKVDDSEIQLEVAEDTKVRILRGMVAEVRAKGEPVKEAS
jgi:preprotein translocase subunit YajC